MGVLYYDEDESMSEGKETYLNLRKQKLRRIIGRTCHLPARNGDGIGPLLSPFFKF